MTNDIFDRLAEERNKEDEPKTDHAKRSTRSTRLNLLVTDETGDRLKLIASSKGISLNEYLNRIFEKEIQEFIKEKESEM